MACAVLLFASPGQAQTGALQGKVTDVAGKPLEKAVVTIEFTDGINRKYEVKTNKKGEFIQIGLAPGNYKVTASFEKLGEQSVPGPRPPRRPDEARVQARRRHRRDRRKTPPRPRP